MSSRRWLLVGAFLVLLIAIGGWVAIELGRDPLAPAVFSGP